MNQVRFDFSLAYVFFGCAVLSSGCVRVIAIFILLFVLRLLGIDDRIC